ncbi:unnamed protein product [Mytilus edulis]|uniref:MSP domain-containing protein n=1 Tax=Mytilus edulis TaxID=6550 RepID=A0A8S3TDA3_MYTED|nr:unnamed protein product [Mytilus edulis]
MVSEGLKVFVRVKEHKKDASVLPEVKRFFAYHLETQYNEDPHSEITLVFDMADAGLSNLDMDLIKFVITCFKDKFQFRYLTPEERLEEENKANRKKVTFADVDKSPVDSSPDNLNNSAPTKQITLKITVIVCEANLPGDELLFTTDETGKETFDVISLKILFHMQLHTSHLTCYMLNFAGKTTSPEKYRVRPSAGIVKAGSTVDVHVYLQQGYNTVSKDKFLIMAMELTSDSADNLQQLWKTVPRENIMEHRLKCSQVHKNGSQDSIASSASSLDQIDKLNTKMDQLMESNRKLEQTVRMMFIVQILFLILILMYYVVLYFFPSSLPPPNPKGNISDYCAGSNLF